jgi:hypothetical protein
VHLPTGCWIEPELYSDSPQLLFRTAEEQLVEWRAAQRELNTTLRAFGYGPVPLRDEPLVIERPRRKRRRVTPPAPVQAEPPPIQAQPEPEDVAITDFATPRPAPVIAAEPEATACDQWHALSSDLPDMAGPAVIYPPTAAIAAIDLRVRRSWLRRVFDKLFGR